MHRSAVELLVWASNLISVVGALSGVALGQYLARRSQRHQRSLDHKTDEYKELLRSLSSAYVALLDVGWQRALPENRLRNVDASNARNLVNESYRLLSGLLFIGSEVNDLNILRRWMEVTRDHGENIDVPTLSNVYGQIYLEITALAKKAAG
jgi:hypothetical protein